MQTAQKHIACYMFCKNNIMQVSKTGSDNVKLKQIMEGINYLIIKGKDDTDISKIEYDSRNIMSGDIFFCIEGYETDGHKYALSAVSNGACAIVCQKYIDISADCTVIKVEDTRMALAQAAANFYGHPAQKMKIIGVTGTNGKTTTTFMIKSILEKAGYKVGLIGTIANYIGESKMPAHRTTPESLELHKLFKEMTENNVDYCVMEVSSHSLSLKRVYGINFSQAIFTNLTQDHLDFYKTFENYYNAKLILFKNSMNSIINIDDEYGKRVFSDISGNKITYSLIGKSDVKADNINMHSRGIGFDIYYKNMHGRINLNIPGKYNVYNALGSAAACLNEGISLETVTEGLQGLKCVPGRCEIVSSGYNLGYEIIVDYAHTPDSLLNILKTTREFTKGKLICVFGCGGDRDKTKRSVMGKIGTQMSDIAVITSDNPRSEEPSTIINDIVKGAAYDNYTVVENRREAIKKAISIARKNDVIVIAGKGHEDYQVLKDKTIHFDEREIVDEIIKELRLEK